MKKLIIKPLILSLILSMCLFTLSVYGRDINVIEIDDTNNKNHEMGYLTEEQVFEAIAFTYDDFNLLYNIELGRVKTPRGFIIEGFHAEDYNKYTNYQYGGMYMDDGVLIICYTEESDALNKAIINNEKNSGKLFNPVGEILTNIAIRAVKYSYDDLLKIYEHLNETSFKYKGISGFGIDIKNNRIVIDIYSNCESENIKKEILSAFNEDSVFFNESDPDDITKDCATIYERSKLDNGGTSPAGTMFSWSKGDIMAL